MIPKHRRHQKQISAFTTAAVIGALLPSASASAWAEAEPQYDTLPESQAKAQAEPQVAAKPQAKSEGEPKDEPSLQSQLLSLSWMDGFDARLGYWSGSLGLNYMDGKQTTTSANAGGSTSTTKGMRELLKISNTGFYIVSPLLCTGSMELDLELNQDKSGGSGSSTATQGNAIGYSVSSTFLAEKPYTATVFANRNQNQTLQPFGGRTMGTNENRGATFHLRQDSILNDWGYPWVEATLDLHQEHQQSTTTNFGHSQSSDEKSRTLDFSANKGFETADLGVNYQFNDQKNRDFSQSNFQSQAANLQYGLDFGPTLNRHFNATLDFLTRNGAATSTAMTNSEHLHIEHYQNLDTDYQYGIALQKSGGTSTTEQNGAFSVSHRLYQNLTTSAGLNGNLSTLPNGKTSSFGGSLGESYHHSLPGKGNFSINWSGSYQVTSNALSSSAVGVIDEVHNAPMPFGAGIGFQLKHDFAVPTSVVVTNVRGGGRIPTSAGIDYDVINENNQIKIVPLAGSLLILPGDPLVVSYNYQVDANLKSATNSTGYGVAVDYHWISASYLHQQSSQKPLSETSVSQFLQSTKQDSLQIGLQGTVLDMEANANMGFDNYNSITTAYQQTKFTSSLVWVVQSNLRMIFGANASQAKYTLPKERESSSRSARSSLNWFTWGGWNHTASIDWSNHNDSDTPAESLIQAIAQSSITLGQLSFTANVALGEWLRGGSRSTNRSFNISIVRQF